DDLIGQEGKGFQYILDGLNAERALIAAECIGDGYWFIEKATRYAKERVVFDRPIGQNQGVQFPIAESYVEVEAANLKRWKACDLFDQHKACGAEANMAKYLAAKASWEAANVCLQTHGGFGFAPGYDETVHGLSSHFVWLNRGKESITLDLKHEEARGVLEKLVARADVLVQNLAPGAAARAGLDYATLAPRHPRLVVADISGYGDSGPYRDKKAYDTLVPAE